MLRYITLEFLYFIIRIFFLFRHYRNVSDADRTNFSRALSLKFILRQRVGCPVSSILCIFHRVQSAKNLCGVVLMRALRKLSSPDDWYGFRSPYFAPPISIRFLIYLLPVPSRRCIKTTPFRPLWRLTSRLPRTNLIVIVFLTKLSESYDPIKKYQFCVFLSPGIFRIFQENIVLDCMI